MSLRKPGIYGPPPELPVPLATAATATIPIAAMTSLKFATAVHVMLLLAHKAADAPERAVASSFTRIIDPRARTPAASQPSLLADRNADNSAQLLLMLWPHPEIMKTISP